MNGVQQSAPQGVARPHRTPRGAGAPVDRQRLWRRSPRCSPSGCWHPASALAANGTISGTVTDQATGATASPGMTVALERTTQGNVVTTAVTDVDGHYTLSPATGQTDYVVEFNQRGEPRLERRLLQRADELRQREHGWKPGRRHRRGCGQHRRSLTNNPGAVSGAVTDATGAGQGSAESPSRSSTRMGRASGRRRPVRSGAYSIPSVESGTDTITFNGDHNQDFTTASGPRDS